MKTLNNKGISIIEIIICFVVVSVIAITLLNTIMEYKTTSQTENIKNMIAEYKNTITKKIQNDIIKNKLINYNINRELNVSLNSKKYDIWTINLIFLKPFESNTSNIYQKDMYVYINKLDNYIIYPDVVYDTENNTYVTQEVKYILEPTTTVQDYQNGVKVTMNDIQFVTPDDSNLIKSDDVFYFDIPIYHSELSSNYHINLVAPLTKQ